MEALEGMTNECSAVEPIMLSHTPLFGISHSRINFDLKFMFLMILNHVSYDTDIGNLLQRGFLPAQNPLVFLMFPSITCHFHYLFLNANLFALFYLFQFIFLHKCLLNSISKSLLLSAVAIFFDNIPIVHLIA